MMEGTEARVLNLTAQLCDQTITAERFAELDQLLASDRGARDTYRGFLALHQRLEGGALKGRPGPALGELSAVGAEPAPPATPDVTIPFPAPRGGTLEGRLRKAERRGMWSMVACLLVALFLVALLLRQNADRPPEQILVDGDASREERASSEAAKKEAGSDTLEEASVNPVVPPPSGPAGSSPDEPAGNKVVRSEIPAPSKPVEIPPPPTEDEEDPAGTVAAADQFEEVQGGYLVRGADLNDTFQLLAKRAGKQYFENSRIAGPEFKVNGHLQDTDPLKQMEELAFMYGLELYRKGNTVYALDAEQVKQVPEQAKLTHPVRSLAPADIEKTRALIASVLSPNGTVEYEPDDDSFSIRGSGREVDRVRQLLSSLDKPTRRPQLASPHTAAQGRAESTATSRGSRDRERAGQTFSLIDRVPIITTTINETEVSNQVTEEVRYQVDLKDPVGDPASTREIGVTVAVDATLLSDGSIRMKLRPRSAQGEGEVITMSGNRYPTISASMIESEARVPEGHSLILGGFYGQVEKKDDSKVPLLGDIPIINFFLKDKDTSRESPNLLFVATPTTINGQVVAQVKILSVNNTARLKKGAELSKNLGEGTLPIETIGKVDSLFAIAETKGLTTPNPTKDAALVPPAGEQPLVLSPTQSEDLLGELASMGLVSPQQELTLVLDGPGPDDIAPPKRDPRDDLEMSATREPTSTFSLNVSDVSLKLARAALARGTWPEPSQVRVEEFVNAFDYGDPSPSQQNKIACRLEQAAHPFLEQRNLLRISMKTASLGRGANTPLRLTLLLDSSGSMDRVDRAESVKSAFRVLAGQLTAADQVTLIGFARTPRLLADRLPGDRVAELADRMDKMPIEGGTNLELALALGLEKARELKLAGGQNRIILLTDGAANLGNADPEDLARLVQEMRGQGIAFDACGVGADGLNDEILESLTRKGDGRYYFLDRPEDADEGFARQIAGALRPAARNVKVQVNFNPERVGRYKLYGFAKHLLQKEDFRNDSVDAAELGAEEAGNALYHFEVLPEGFGDIGAVSVRFQDPASGRMVEREWTIPYEPDAPRLEEAAASLQLASSAALLAERLVGSPIGESVEMEPLGKLVHGLGSAFPSQRSVGDLIQMVDQMREQLGE